MLQTQKLPVFVTVQSVLDCQTCWVSAEAIELHSNPSIAFWNSLLKWLPDDLQELKLGLELELCSLSKQLIIFSTPNHRTISSRCQSGAKLSDIFNARPPGWGDTTHCAAQPQQGVAEHPFVSSDKCPGCMAAFSLSWPSISILDLREWLCNSLHVVQSENKKPIFLNRFPDSGQQCGAWALVKLPRLAQIWHQ